VPEPEPPAGTPGSRRLPRPRVAVEQLRDRRRRADEGLAWLGRRPEARASPLYRVVRLLVRSVLFGVFRFRVATSGQEHLPDGGYLVVAAAHRGWMDPFVVLHALPPEPRAWFLGSAASTFTSPWREWLARRLGGLLPVWRGGLGVEQHVGSARAVLAGGGVFVQMPEGTVSGPPGKRMASRVLPATSVGELLEPGWDGRLPAEGSREELALARRVSDALAERLGPAVESLHPSTLDPPRHPRRLAGWLTWLLLGRGPLDRT